MRKLLKALSLVTVLVASSLVLWSCDNLSNPTEPGSGLRPARDAVFSTADGTKFKVVRNGDALGTVSATIGEAGGRLMLGKHRLIVPAGAVSGPTVFTVTGVESELLRLRLSATRETHNDVGARGFAVPLQLELSFENASDLPEDFETLIVVYFQPDGLIAEQETAVDTYGHKAIGSLPHFSDYGLAWPL